ncbi:hypothetical protein EYF80_037622 [Liparis tanakae]|uniref:Uncharacterized protein n=1 Tax=Liparis tanakae TaxID=230148 RepID=A0A4Z2GHQ0_9TELE|nr:hypothetical protein EYF80_037622 [Liparis tanakae]
MLNAKTRGPKAKMAASMRRWPGVHSMVKRKFCCGAEENFWFYDIRRFKVNSESQDIEDMTSIASDGRIRA